MNSRIIKINTPTTYRANKLLYELEYKVKVTFSAFLHTFGRLCGRIQYPLFLLLSDFLVVLCQVENRKFPETQKFFLPTYLSQNYSTGTSNAQSNCQNSQVNKNYPFQKLPHSLCAYHMHVVTAGFKRSFIAHIF